MHSSSSNHSQITLIRRLGQKRNLVMVSVLIAIIGVSAFVVSRAATPYVSIEAEKGTLSGDASIDPDQTASGEDAIQFGSSGINPAPTGPTIPTGGWHVDFADDFNTPLGTGTGEDNFWYPNQPWEATSSTSTRGDQGYETEMYNSSQVSVANGNLVLTAKYDDDVGPATGDGSGSSTSNLVQRNYLSGLVSSTTSSSGYKGFNWTPGDGSTWAFEIDAQFPVNTGDLFNAWWSTSQDTWTNERDFFEGKSTTDSIDTDWIYSTNNDPAGKEQNYYVATLGFDPATAMHRYTYVVFPNQSWSYYIDGVLQTWVGTDGVAPVQTGVNLPMQLEINYALTATKFTTGTRQFLINSIAVYEDTDHAGQFTTGGGIAPGTKIN